MKKVLEGIFGLLAIVGAFLLGYAIVGTTPTTVIFWFGAFVVIVMIIGVIATIYDWIMK